MYRIPPYLDIAPIVGEFTTQVCVGQFDLQFTLGVVRFMVTSEVRLTKRGEVVGTWDEGRWPDPAFYDVMNAAVESYELASDQEIVIHLENGVQIHLFDDSDQYECIQIIRSDNSARWII